MFSVKIAYLFFYLFKHTKHSYFEVIAHGTPHMPSCNLSQGGLGPFLWLRPQWGWKVSSHHVCYKVSIALWTVSSIFSSPVQTFEKDR